MSNSLRQSMEFSRPEYWSGWPFPSPGDLPNPGIEPRSPALQAGFLLPEPPRKPKNFILLMLGQLQVLITNKKMCETSKYASEKSEVYLHQTYLSMLFLLKQHDVIQQQGVKSTEAILPNSKMRHIWDFLFQQ